MFLKSGSGQLSSGIKKLFGIQAMYLLFFLLKMGQSRPLFVYFRYFLDTISIIQIEKSIDGVLGNPGPQDGRRRRNHGAMAATTYFDQLNCRLKISPVKQVQTLLQKLITPTCQCCVTFTDIRDCSIVIKKLFAWKSFFLSLSLASRPRGLERPSREIK